MAATSLHHIALACKDPVETHRFYHDVLGLRLVHTESQAGPKGERVTHFFYDLGDGSLLAFFDLHGVGEPDPLDPAISTGLGLPIWVNHFALRRDLAELPAIRERIARLRRGTDHGSRPRLVHVALLHGSQRDPDRVLRRHARRRGGRGRSRAGAVRIDEAVTLDAGRLPRPARRGPPAPDTSI